MSTGPCRFFAAGRCTRGARCRFDHALPADGITSRTSTMPGVAQDKHDAAGDAGETERKVLERELVEAASEPAKMVSLLEAAERNGVCRATDYVDLLMINWRSFLDVCDLRPDFLYVRSPSQFDFANWAHEMTRWRRELEGVTPTYWLMLTTIDRREVERIFTALCDRDVDLGRVYTEEEEERLSMSGAVPPNILGSLLVKLQGSTQETLLRMVLRNRPYSNYSVLRPNVAAQYFNAASPQPPLFRLAKHALAGLSPACGRRVWDMAMRLESEDGIFSAVNDFTDQSKSGAQWLLSSEIAGMRQFLEENLLKYIAVDALFACGHHHPLNHLFVVPKGTMDWAYEKSTAMYAHSAGVRALLLCSAFPDANPECIFSFMPWEITCSIFGRSAVRVAMQRRTKKQVVSVNTQSITVCEIRTDKKRYELCTIKIPTCGHCAEELCRLAALSVARQISTQCPMLSDKAKIGDDVVVCEQRSVTSYFFSITRSAMACSLSVKALCTFHLESAMVVMEGLTSSFVRDGYY